VQALAKTSKEFGYTPKILDAVESVNYEQKRVLANKVIKRFGEDLSGRTFALWGLSFKPETDDMREASSITIINELTSRGAKIKAYDPKAFEEAKECYLKDNASVEYVQSKYDALNGSDGMLLVTEWKEFRSPDFEEMRKRLNTAVIFDGRNQYDRKKLESRGFEYHQIGVQS
jgi:UDPglucose 6-dehydrogenase